MTSKGSISVKTQAYFLQLVLRALVSVSCTASSQALLHASFGQVDVPHNHRDRDVPHNRDRVRVRTLFVVDEAEYIENSLKEAGRGGEGGKRNVVVAIGGLECSYTRAT